MQTQVCCDQVPASCNTCRKILNGEQQRLRGFGLDFNNEGSRKQSINKNYGINMLLMICSPKFLSLVGGLMGVHNEKNI